MDLDNLQPLSCFFCFIWAVRTPIDIVTFIATRCVFCHKITDGQTNLRFCFSPPPTPLAVMPPLSSLHISGVFTLTDGIRNADPTYYMQYLTALEFSDDTNFINVSVRKFTPTVESLYEDRTFVFMVAKAALPPGEDGMLDSINCTPFGSPSEGFALCIPPEPTHTAFATGVVSRVRAGAAIKSFDLTIVEYVRDERRTFDIRYVSLSIYLPLHY